MCCVVLFRSSNQSHLRSPGEELYTGQFVTTIRVPINDLTETCSCMGGAYYKGSLIHLLGVNSLDTKAQRLGVRLHFPPGVACMGSLVGEWLFVLITLTLFHLYNVKPLVTLNRFSVGIMYLTSNVMNIMCFFISWHAGLFIAHPSEGSNLTPAHHYPDFRFKTYAPLAFRYFRDLFGIKPDDYLVRLKPGLF